MPIVGVIVICGPFHSSTWAKWPGWPLWLFPDDCFQQVLVGVLSVVGFNGVCGGSAVSVVVRQLCRGDAGTAVTDIVVAQQAF